MYTSCPECGTVFRITTGDLRVAEGYVRCGHCSAIFNAVLSLSEEMPAALGNELGQSQGQDQRDEEEHDPEVPAGKALPTAEDWLAGAADEEGDDGELPARPDAMADHGTPSMGAAIDEDTHDDIPGDTDDDIVEGREPGAEPDWPLAPAPGGPREPPADPAEWSTLFDEEDLREVTSRIAVEISAGDIQAGDDDAWPEGTAVEDEADGDGSPVYLIDDSSADADLDDSGEEAAAIDEPGTDAGANQALPVEAPAVAALAVGEAAAEDSGGQPPAGEGAGAFGPWAWEAPASPDEDSAGGEASPYPPPPSGRREPPAHDLWAEEFGDLVIEPDDDGEPGSRRREPRLGEDFGPEPADADTGEHPTTPEVGEDGPPPAAPVTAGQATEDLLHTPRWARDSLVNDDLAPPRDPGEPGALPPLWAPRPGAWDDRAADDAGDRRRWAFGLGSLVLGLLLVLQLVHQQRDDLATGPTLGPVLRQAYAALGFPLMPRWNLAAYEIRGTEAVAGRSQAGSLDVLARIHVVGTEAVGLPLVRVMLRDRFGKPLGSRSLEPAEYLEAGTTVSEPLEPGTVLTVRASLADPGSEAYGYEVDVCLRDRSTGLRCQSQQAPFKP